MDKIQLTPRLQQIADWVQQGDCFADIGTDHGYLPLYLLQESRITVAIAADLREKPLEKARESALRYKKTLSLRLCDGLSGISADEVTTIAIAGMGGETIAQILKDTPWLANWSGRLLLQPMSTQFELRSYLSDSRFFILKERTIREGKTLYTVMEVTPSKHESLTLGACMVGKHDPEDKARGLMLQSTKNKLEKAMEGAARAQDAQARTTQLQAQIQAVDTMQKEWDLCKQT